MFPMRDVESCEGHEPRAIAFERHESGIPRDKSFDSIGEKMEPVKLGAKFYSGRMPGYPSMIINPADNVAGIILRTGVFNGSYRSIVTTGTVAPANSSDTTTPVVMFLTGPENRHQLQYPILLPPGYGLWGSSNGSTSLDVFITYDIL